MAATTRPQGRLGLVIVGTLCIGGVVALVALATQPPNRSNARLDQAVQTTAPTSATPTSNAPTTEALTTAAPTTAAPVTPLTDAPPRDLGTLVVSPVQRPDCGTVLPVAVDVPDSAGPLDGPAPDTPPVDQQVVRHWVTSKWTVEIRWPADRREFEIDGVMWDAVPLLVDSTTVITDGAAAAWGRSTDPGGRLIYTIDDVPGVDVQRLPRGCRELQVRVTTPDGSRRTMGYPLPIIGTDGSAFDLDPLIGLRRATNAIVPRDRSTECPDLVDSVGTVRFEVPSASPADALRDFLESEVGTAVPRAMLPRPFEETFLESDGTYRYEHFLAWYEYVAITVDHLGDGWSVTNWEHGNC